MRERKEIKVGDKFGNLTVEELFYVMRGETKRFTARCRCGCPDETVKNVLVSNLKSGVTKSCGCFKYRTGKDCPTSRLCGLSASERRLHKIWREKRLTGMCEEWGDSFKLFVKWLKKNGYNEKKHLIGRINDDEPYSPTNTELRLGSRGKYRDETGRRVSLEKILEGIDVSRTCYYERRLKGMSHEEASTLPAQPQVKAAKKYLAFGEEKTVSEWLEDERCVISRPCLYSRLHDGVDFEEAISFRRLGKK